MAFNKITCCIVAVLLKIVVGSSAAGILHYLQDNLQDKQQDASSSFEKRSLKSEVSQIESCCYLERNIVVVT